jgi:hypothetical protein
MGRFLSDGIGYALILPYNLLHQIGFLRFQITE